MGAPDGPDRPTSDFGVMMSDLTMLVGTGGSERTDAEFRTLLAAAGLKIRAITPMHMSLCIIEAVPARKNSESDLH